MNDCALNHHLTQERTIREFQTAIQNLEQKIADQENYINDLKARLVAAVTVSGASSHPGDSEDRIYLP
jgi:translation initiation factor 1 (eIF-1/SUI1)